MQQWRFGEGDDRRDVDHHYGAGSDDGIDHHEYMAGTDASMAPGFETTDKLKTSKAAGDYWAKTYTVYTSTTGASSPA